ncbi:MAG: hypothetical protein WCN88_01505 [Candidatus Falkowbacteria bacterium]
MKANLVKINTEINLSVPPLALSHPVVSVGLAKSIFSAGVDQEIIALINLAHSSESLSYDHKLSNRIVLMPLESRILVAANLGKLNRKQNIVIKEIRQTSNVYNFRPADFYEWDFRTGDPLDVSLTLRRIIYLIGAYPGQFEIDGQVSLFPLFGLPDIRVIKVVRKTSGLYASMYTENESIPMPWSLNFCHRIFQVASLS